MLVGPCTLFHCANKETATYPYPLSFKWVLDVLICNWVGTYLGKTHPLEPLRKLIFPSLGMKVCQYFEVKVTHPLPPFRSALFISVRQPYEWRGLRQHRGLRSKARRVLSQFSPHDFTAFKWGTASSFMHYIIVVLLLAVFLAAELNPFYLKVRLLACLGVIDGWSVRRCCGWSLIILSSL